MWLCCKWPATWTWRRVSCPPMPPLLQPSWTPAMRQAHLWHGSGFNRRLGRFCSGADMATEPPIVLLLAASGTMSICGDRAAVDTCVLSAAQVWFGPGNLGARASGRPAMPAAAFNHAATCPASTQKPRPRGLPNPSAGRIKPRCAPDAQPRPPLPSAAAPPGCPSARPATSPRPRADGRPPRHRRW